jgi:hypothetical protein
LKLVEADGRSLYGVVVIYNHDGSINREFRVSKEELDRVNASARGIPSGVTREEWESGRARLVGKRLDVGYALAQNDGTIHLMLASREEGGRITDIYARLRPRDYTGQLPEISLTQDALRESQYIESLTDGELTLKAEADSRG